MTEPQTAAGALRSDGDRCAVHFERLYDFTPDELWSALTDPRRLRRWLADTPRFEGRAGGQVELAFDEGTAEGRVLTWDEPRVLEYEWRFPGEDESVVRFELRPQDAGTLLVLDHWRLGRAAGTGYAAGWHAHLDALAGAIELVEWQQRLEGLLPLYRAQADDLGWNRLQTSPVREAVYRGDRAAAEAAAEGAALDVFDAAALGRLDRLRELLDADPRLVDALSDDGFTPLHLAAFGGGAETVRLLAERGAPLEKLSEATFAQVRPLGTAVFAGRRDTVEALLDAGADPNGPAEGGFVPLEAAEQNGDEEVAELLRERGATLPA